MCNAWNHSLDCRCGWGGLGHLGRASLHPSMNVERIKFKTYRELLIGTTYPNAYCPVCSARVFFYESPNGGRVFFDELGPPWPKHPCTDHRHYLIGVQKINIDFDTLETIKAPQKVDGWVPFLCEIVTHIPTDKTIQKIEGWLDGQRKSFFIRDGRMTDGEPYFVKCDSNQWFLSTLVVDEKKFIEPITLRAFIFESELHDLLPQDEIRPSIRRRTFSLAATSPQSLKLPRRPKGKSAKKQSKINKNQIQTTKIPKVLKKTAPPRIKTSFELAMDRAKKGKG